MWVIFMHYGGSAANFKATLNICIYLSEILRGLKLFFMNPWMLTRMSSVSVHFSRIWSQFIYFWPIRPAFLVCHLS